MARRKKVVKKQAVHGKILPGDGGKQRYGTMVTLEDGSKRLLLTPYGKGRKAANELLLGYRIRNENADPKVDRDGVIKSLSPTQKAWRSGYLSARSDAAKAYESKK